MNPDDESTTAAPLESTDGGPFVCPVCGYDGLAEPPYNADGNGSYEICPSCGFEYGFDDHDQGISHDDARATWLAAGAEWFDPDQRPDDWDLRAQLARIGHEADADSVGTGDGATDAGDPDDG